MLGLYPPLIFSHLTTRFTQQTKASPTPNKGQPSSNTPVTLSNLGNSPLCARLKSSLLTKLAEKILVLSNHGLQKDSPPITTKLERSKSYFDFIRSKLTGPREKSLVHAAQQQQAIDPLLQNISDLPIEIQKMIGDVQDTRLLYWQAHTIPTHQNKPAYFLRDENDQPVLDDRNQAVQVPYYRYHLLARRSIPLEYQQQILVRDPQLYKLFCNTQFRTKLVAQFAQKPLTQIAIDTNIQQCALLLFFLRTKEEAALEQCQRIVDIFESYLTQAQPEIVEQALVELIQYLPCFPHVNALQLRVIKLVKPLLSISNYQAAPTWAGIVCANLALIENILSIQACLLSRMYVKQHGQQIIDYLQQITRRLPRNNERSNELILLARLRNYSLLNTKDSFLQNQVSQIVSKNLSKIREELEGIIQTFRSAPSQKLNSLVKILQLRTLLTEAQRIEVSRIMITNVRHLPKALWTQLLPFLHRQRPQVGSSTGIPTEHPQV